MYSGDLSREELYDQDTIHIVEETYEIDADWISIDDVIAGKIILYPALDYKNLFTNTIDN